MAGAKGPILQTETHDGPAFDGVRSGREVFVVAFPIPRVLAVPISGEVVGREWLETAQGQDAKASSKHVSFTRAGGGLFVEDVGSRNGTSVNGAPIPSRERVRIDEGAVLRVGHSLLVYRDNFVGGDAPSPALGRLVGPFGLRHVRESIDGIAARKPQNILIEGETGSGKELVAAAVAHALGRSHRYTAINIAGLAPGVFESQLFGYVAGAYSGSGRGSDGILVAHDHGAVFLDEIGELQLELQAKILRVLDNREVLAVGALRSVKVDVAIIAATNRSLEEMVAENRFRQDLLARLATARIDLPPLRERREDIFAICQALLATRGERFDEATVEVEAVERLLLHEWPSNVRELAATLERIAMIEPPPHLRRQTVDRVLGPGQVVSPPLTSDSVRRALGTACGNQSEAARLLNVKRGTLLRWLRAQSQ